MKVYPHIYKLERYIEQGYVTKRKHPFFPLWIYNYTSRAVEIAPFDWDEPLIDARGLVLREDGLIVARGFKKFWNYQQVLDDIPANEPFHVYEKLDGSLLLVFTYNGERIVATRGSFTSEQAIAATNWFNNAHPDFYPEEHNTWLFEWIAPENRIVVDYGKRTEAVQLAVLDENGEALPPFRSHFKKARTITKYDETNYLDKLAAEEHLGTEAEGYVVHWPNSDFRCKIKFEDYVRLHRIMFTLSNRSIWEMLKNGQNYQLVDVLPLPKPAAEWINIERESLLRAYQEIYAAALEDLELMRRAGMEYGTPRFGKFCTESTRYPAVVFGLARGRSVASIIWKLLRPEKWIPYRHASLDDV